MKDTYIPEVSCIMLVLGMIGFAMLVQGCVSTQTIVVPTAEHRDCAAILTTIGVTDWVKVHEKLDIECYHIGREVSSGSKRTITGVGSRSSTSTDRSAVDD